jgi:probable addiction module antidote protein
VLVVKLWWIAFRISSERLKNSERAGIYLEAAIEEYQTTGNKKAFLRSLRNVAEAQGGIGQLAEKTSLNRQHLYTALSEKGNPRFDTIGKILQGLGYKISILHL